MRAFPRRLVHSSVLGGVGHGIRARMTSAAFYRREARHCRAAAVATPDPATAVRWLRIARDYDTLADALTTEETRLPPAIPQPLQQSQAKLKDD